MPFPWGQPALPVSFTCPHCKDVKSVMHGDKVQACDCPGAQKERVQERQLVQTHSQNMEEAYQARIKEIRRKRREKQRGD
jgi:glutaredoxin